MWEKYRKFRLALTVYSENAFQIFSGFLLIIAGSSMLISKYTVFQLVETTELYWVGFLMLSVGILFLYKHLYKRKEDIKEETEYEKRIENFEGTSYNTFGKRMGQMFGAFLYPSKKK
tara:strand:- start:50 stop:400 length:351 start_codon:yes stop_codon:yes gene_type:complete